MQLLIHGYYGRGGPLLNQSNTAWEPSWKYGAFLLFSVMYMNGHGLVVEEFMGVYQRASE